MSNNLNTTAELATYLNAQLENFFPDRLSHKADLLAILPDALDRMLFSISHVKLRGYTEFNHLHSDLYAQFLYFVANTVWTLKQNKILASKLFYLNKSLHGINCMYDTQLPEIFLLIHCMGSMLGKATYSNYFICCQNITIGSDRGVSPVLEGPLYMGPGSSIVGDSIIGANTHLSIGASVLHRNIPADSLVIGSYPNLEIKPSKRNLISDIYFTT